MGPSINFTKSAVLNRSTTSDNKTLLGLMREIDIVLFGIGPFRVGVSGTYNLMGRRDVGPFELADSQFRWIRHDSAISRLVYWSVEADQTSSSTGLESLRRR